MGLYVRHLPVIRSFSSLFILVYETAPKQFGLVRDVQWKNNHASSFSSLNKRLESYLRHHHQEKLNNIGKLASQSFHVNVWTNLLERVNKFVYESQGMIIEIKLNHFSLKVVKKICIKGVLKTRHIFKVKTFITSNWKIVRYLLTTSLAIK